MNTPPRPMRLLVITFSYRPMLNARAFRWTALAEKFAADGARVDVVTSWVPGARHRDTVDGVVVHRAGWRWLESIRSRLQRRRTAAVTEPDMSSARPAAARRAASGLLRFAAEHLWRNLYWPDTSCLWYFPARTVARSLVDKERYDAVISVAPTFTAILVGRHATRNGRVARWILDLGDPFSLLAEAPPNNAALYGALNRAAERAALQASAAVSVTNEATRAMYAEAFPEIAAKVQVIPPLLSAPASGSATASPFRAEAGVVRLVYVGTLYRGLRAPDFLIGLFATAAVTDLGAGLQLHFFGDTSACADSFSAFRDWLGSRFFLHGVVARDVVAAALEQADVLVNIGNTTPFQLPSKLVEYAASGKPILNIARAEDDSSARFLERYPDHLNLQDRDGIPLARDHVAFADFLAGLPRRVPTGALREFLLPYTLEKVAARYLDLVGTRQ